MREKDQKYTQLYLFIPIYSNWSFSRTYITMHDSENVKFITVFTTACHLYMPCIKLIRSTTDLQNLLQFIFQLTHTTLKNVVLLKHFKIRKLLQHISVYKETIIREPQSVLS